MCKMWESIRYGVRWRPRERFALAARALNLKNVEKIHISMDPFNANNNSLRYFWHVVTTTKVKMTNPRVKVTNEIRNDGKAPYFVADLIDKKKLVFKTEGMEPMDVLMRFNRLIGNPEMGNAGMRQPIK